MHSTCGSWRYGPRYLSNSKADTPAKANAPAQRQCRRRRHRTWSKAKDFSSAALRICALVADWSVSYAACARPCAAFWTTYRDLPIATVYLHHLLPPVPDLLVAERPASHNDLQQMLPKAG